MTLYAAGLRRGEAMNLTWRDLDFERSLVHVDRKDAVGYVQAWEPKDAERRSVPLPAQAIDLLAAWQPAAPDGCPYVFMPPGRWEYYRGRVDAGRWREGQHLVNNQLRRFKTLCRRAGVGPYTLHDLRRSCITNWAAHLPIHVTQELAGHSDIQTTQRYYLRVQEADLARARRVQDDLVDGVPARGPTDTKRTHRGQSRSFPPTKGARRES